jgi:molecular chaperone DnaK
MSNIIGIDLGTTFSAIASLDAVGKPEIVQNLDGSRITPSVVFFPPDEPGKVYVGEVARDLLVTQPSRGIEEIKRHMSDGQFQKKFDGKTWSPEEMSSLILKKLIEDAEEITGKIDSAVITVPANFSEDARAATMAAGELAGITVSHIINEPTAAALYFASLQPVTGTMMIYDLGGGTFDATIARVHDQNVECIASQGDAVLGGKDFDRAVLDLIRKSYMDEKGVDIVDEENTEEQWLMEAEKIKCQLSQKDSVKRPLKGPAGMMPFSLSRTEFVSNDKVANMISRTEMLVDTVLDEASMTPADIDAVLLVGGSTRIPAIQDSITKMFGKPPIKVVNPDEAVAMGAAIYAGINAPRESLSVAQQKEMDKVELQEVASHYFGTISVTTGPSGYPEEKNNTIIKKNAVIPCSATQTYFTVNEGQEVIDCRVTQSNAEEFDPQFVKVVWEGEMELPPGRPEGMPVEVTYSYDKNNQMHVLFKDVDSGKTLEADIHPGETEKIQSLKTQIQTIIVE